MRTAAFVRPGGAGIQGEAGPSGLAAPAPLATCVGPEGAGEPVASAPASDKAPRCWRSVAVGGIELSDGSVADRWREVGGHLKSCVAVRGDGSVVEGFWQTVENLEANVRSGAMEACGDAPVGYLSAWRWRRAQHWLKASDRALERAAAALLTRPGDGMLHAEILEARARVLKAGKAAGFSAEAADEAAGIPARRVG
jgi:hypothetical protein